MRKARSQLEAALRKLPNRADWIAWKWKYSMVRGSRLCKGLQALNAWRTGSRRDDSSKGPDATRTSLAMFWS